MVVYQMLQQQRQRELQRLTLTGALSSTSASAMIAQSPALLSSSTTTTTTPPLPGSQGNAAGLFGLQDTALHKTGVSDDQHRGSYGQSN